MKKLLAVLLFSALTNMTLSQPIVQNRQTINNDKVLAMNVAGQKNGHPFYHSVHFDASGMAQIYRDSLYQKTVQTPGAFSIEGTPNLMKQVTDTTTGWKQVTFTCATCTGKGRLEVFGNGITATRIIDSRPDENHSFPLKLSLLPGDYRLMYYQKRVLQIQSTFTVRVGEETKVNVK